MAIQTGYKGGEAQRNYDDGWDRIFGKKPAPTNKCNVHDDCDQAEREHEARTGEKPGPLFHCYSDECEECFPK